MEIDGAVDVDKQVLQMDLLISQTTALASTVEELIRHQSSGNNQTVIHKTEGVGGWVMAALAVAVTSCIFTFFGLILFAGEVRTKQQTFSDEIRDLKAWEQVHQAKISSLEAKEKAK